MSIYNSAHHWLISKYYFKYFLIIFFFCVDLKSADAQQFNNWVFPDFNGITFNTNPISFLAGGRITPSTGFSTASISDRNGNLLFYSDGEKVWNKNNQQMPNGNGLLGDGGQINTALIIPFIQDSTKYYLFTSKGLLNYVSGIQSTLPYCYSIIDLQLDGGLGDVVSKNTLIQNFSTEKMVSILNANGIDIWWICRDWTNHFYSYKITCNGFQNNSPILSTVGKNVNNDAYLLGAGDIKASPDGRFIAASYANYTEVYRFNNSTGVISNPIIIPSNFTSYGIEFSANSKLLYITGQEAGTNGGGLNYIRQYDLSNYDSALINNSSYRLDSTSGYGGLQLGPDEKIYNNSGGAAIDVINNPNIQGVGCNFQDSIIVLPNSAYRRFPYSYVNLISNQNVQISYNVAPDCRTVTLQAKTYIKGNTLAFKWKFGDGDSSIQNVASGGDTTYTTIVHTYPPGVDTFFANLTVTSDTVCGLGRAGAKVVVKPPPPIAAFGFLEPACGSTNVQFADSSRLNFNPSLSYQWSFKRAGSTLPFTNFSTVQNPSFNFPSLDSFDVQLTVSSSLSCVASNSIIKRLYLKAKPIAAFTATNNCGSLTASFTSTSSVVADNIQTYQWQFGDGQIASLQNPVINFTSYGNQTAQLKVTSTRGCVSDPVIQTIRIKDKPVVTITSAKDSVCSNISFTLNGNASVQAASISSYQWQLAGNTIGNTSSLAQSPATPGSYRYALTATSDAECVSDTAFKIITVVGKPTAAFSFTNACGSLSIPFTASSSVSNDVIAQHYWSFGDNSFSTQQNPVKTYTAFLDAYTVRYAATSSIGCASDTVVQNILVKDKPTASISFGNNACENRPFPVQGNSTVNNASISSQQWWVNNGPVGGNTNIINITRPAGTYMLQYLATSSKGCASDTATRSITVDALPVVNFTTANTCTGQPISLQNNSTGGNNVYKWYFGNGDSSTAVSPAYQYNNAGNYSIRLVASTPNNCSATATQSIAIELAPVAAFTVAESCIGKPVSILNNSSNAVQYNWLSSDGQSAAATLPAFQYAAAGTYNIQLTATSRYGCSNVVRKNILLQPVQLITNNDTSIFINQPLQLLAAGAASYLWQPATLLSNGSIANPVFTTTNGGAYTLTVEGTTAQGCKGSNSINITAFSNAPGLLPNAFSPNGDANNPTFRFNCTGMRSLTYFRIYNRYGQIIYNQSGCNATGWNGMYNGTPQNPGAYVYVWQGVDFTGKTVSGKGTVVLIR